MQSAGGPGLLEVHEGSTEGPWAILGIATAGIEIALRSPFIMRWSNFLLATFLLVCAPLCYGITLTQLNTTGHELWLAVEDIISVCGEWELHVRHSQHPTRGQGHTVLSPDRTTSEQRVWIRLVSVRWRILSNNKSCHSALPKFEEQL
jgi:hypothetical protein